MLSGMYLVLSAVTFAIVVWALVDIVTRDEWRVRHLPKMVWVLLVILLPLIGSVLWFIVGHEYGDNEGNPGPLTRARPGSDFRSYPAPPTPSSRTTEQQLADLEREIEFHEKQARLQQLKAEAERRREPDGVS